MTTLRLRDACTKIGSGATPRGGKDVYLDSGEVALIRSQNVYIDRFERNGLAFIGPEHAAQLSNVEVQRNDVLLNITGDSVARVCQVPANVLPARVNQHVAIIRPDPRRLDPRFLRFFLAGPQMQAEMLALAAAGATRNALTKGMIESFEVPGFSINDQREIAALLGVFEDKIELNRRMNETLEAMARAIFKDWFVDFGPTRAKAEGLDPYLAPEIWDLFPDALDDDGKPVGWFARSIYDFADVVYGAPFSSKQFNSEGAGIPLIRIRDLATHQPGVSTEEVHKKGHMIAPGDIVVGMDGEFRLHVWKGPNSWLNQRVCHFEPKVGVTNAYLVEALKEPLDFFERGKVGTTVIHLGKSDIDTFELMFPGEHLLTAFGRLAEPLVDRTVANALESHSLAQTRDLLLPKLMSSEIRLTDAEKAIEAVA